MSLARVGDQPGQPLLCAGERHHLEAQVRAVEAGQHLASVGGDAEPREDVLPHGGVGGRGERERAGTPESLARAAEREVVGSEIVSPLGDAVRLVDDEQPHTAAREAVEEAPVREPLRGDVEQRGAPRLEVGVAAVLLGAVERGVDEACRDADRLEGLDLVLHERDQRRDHERAADLERGQHVAEALASARRHHAERVLRSERLKHLRLAGAEVWVAEAILEQLAVASGVAREVRGRRRPSRGAPRWFFRRERQGRLDLRDGARPVRAGARRGTRARRTEPPRSAAAPRSARRRRGRRGHRGAAASRSDCSARPHPSEERPFAHLRVRFGSLNPRVILRGWTGAT